MSARSCPFCGEGVSAVAPEYAACGSCDVWISTAPPAGYDADYYPFRRFRSAASWKRSRLLLGLFRNEVTGRRGLDFGCNDGTFVIAAGRAGASFAGTDVNRAAVERSRREGGGEFLLPEEVGGEFEVVTAFDVIEHFDDPDRFLEQAGRRLKPGGSLVITTPNKNSKWAGIFRQGWHGFGIPQYHRLVLSRRFLEGRLARHGFSVARLFSVPPVAAAGWRLLVASGYRLGGSRTGKVLRLPAAVAGYLKGRLFVKGEDDTLCAVARKS